MERKKEISEELAMIAPFLAEAGNGLPFREPIAYFDHLADGVLSRIHDEELVAVTPLLHSIGKHTGYAAPPAGYFNKALSIPVPESSPAKIVALKGYRRVVQYVAAAMLAGVLVSGAFMFTDSKTNLKTIKGDSAQNTIQSYPVETGHNNEIAAENNENSLPELRTDNTVKRMPTFAKQVSSLSDDELQDYLDENTQAESIQLSEEDTEI